MSYQHILNSRLQSCLETILELEEILEGSNRAEKNISNEFAVLRDAFKRLSTTSVSEQDVCQVEVATSKFLGEIRQTLADTQTGQRLDKRNLQ